MDSEREDYADRDLPPPVRWGPDVVRLFLTVLGVIAAMAVVSVLLQGCVIPR